MQRQIYFCKSWFRAKKIPTEVWSEEQASAAHERERPYTVLVDSLEKPYCFVEVAKGFVGVGFLDEFLRESLTYQFQEVGPNQLFLTMATYREFDGASDKVKIGTSYIFDRSGVVDVRREVFVPEHRLETSKSEADVSSNYVRFPSFGQYDEFLQVERS